MEQRSRIREYADRLHNENMLAGQIADWEAQVEEAERNALRLNRELMDEISERAKSDRARAEAEAENEQLRQEVEELRQEVEEMRRQIDEYGRRGKRSRKGRAGTGRGRAVSGGVQRVDGGAAHEQSDGSQPVDGSGDELSSGPSGVPRSARKRGGVK